MALNTFSFFNYGHTVTLNNQNIDFVESGGPLNAKIAIGDYSLGEFVVAIANALNAVAVTNVFIVGIDRNTNKITITSNVSNFSLLIQSGVTTGASAFSLMGFNGADLSGSMSYTGDTPSGSQFKPQCILQDYVSSDDSKEYIEASVNESASGVVETINFGLKSYIEFSIPWITSILEQDHRVIKADSQGLQNARDFFYYAINKSKFEFVADIDSPLFFKKVLLETTPENRRGTAFKFKERLKDSLPGYYQTGKIKLRVVE